MKKGLLNRRTAWIMASAVSLRLALGVGTALAQSPVGLAIQTQSPGPAIPPGFSGLSFGTTDLQPGTNGYTFDSTTSQTVTLIQQLGTKTLRIGGSTVESVTPTTSDVDALFRFAAVTGVSMIYSLPLDVTNDSQDVPMAEYIWTNYLPYLNCFAIGNEPEGTNFPMYFAQWSPIVAAITNALPDAVFGGPDGSSDLKGKSLGTNLAAIEAGTGLVADIQFHYYPGGSDANLTAAEVISNELLFTRKYPYEYNTSGGPILPYGIPYRFTEVESYDSGSGGKGVPGGGNSFASALFALDFMHWWATNGCQAACFHTTRGHFNGVFYYDADGNYQLYPVGYGIKAFDVGGHGNAIPLGITNNDELNLTAYAVADSTNLYVTIINKENGGTARDAAMTIAPVGEEVGNVAAMFLVAPDNDPGATNGITLGGAPISDSGPWLGQWTPLGSLTNGQFGLTVPASSAAIVRISPGNWPFISKQPTNELVQTNATATFSVVASGVSPVYYNWFFNGTNLQWATNSTLNITNAQTANAGSYDVVVSNSYGSVTSAMAVLTVLTARPIIYPSVLTERVGDHVAFTVSAAGASATYQWYFASAGVANILMGQIGSSLILTNIQPTNAGVYQVVVGNIGGAVTNSATLNVSTASIPLPATNLVVARVGDGAQALSGATGNTLYLDQYITNGAYVSTIQIPDESAGATYGTGSSASVFGSPALLVQGLGSDAGYEAFLTLSYNQRYLCFAGYCLNYPYSGSDVTGTAGNGGDLWRGLGEVNASGFYTLAYTNSLYSEGNHTIRSMVSLDGATNFWTTGQASSGGVKYVNSTVSTYAEGDGIPYDKTSTQTGARVVQILNNGNLAYSDAAADPPGIYWSTGTPEPEADGSFKSSLLVDEGGQPNDFAFSPDYRTVYIADSQSFAGSLAQAGGIERWDTSTPGSGYTFSYTLPCLAGATNGAQGLTVTFPVNIASWGPQVTGAIVYATSCGAVGNSLVQIVDTGAGFIPTVLATAGPNQALRGIRFGPTGDIPVIIWPSPAPINYGTPLGASQLNATANVPGNFVYTPPSGSMLPVGTNLLSVIFTPSDTNDYLSVTATVGLVVAPGTLPTLRASLVAINNVQFQFGGGAPDANYVLQYATNLSPPITWLPLVTNAADASGNWTFTDTNSAAFPASFFRVVIP